MSIPNTTVSINSFKSFFIKSFMKEGSFENEFIKDSYADFKSANLSIDKESEAVDFFSFTLSFYFNKMKEDKGLDLYLAFHGIDESSFFNLKNEEEKEDYNFYSGKISDFWDKALTDLSYINSDSILEEIVNPEVFELMDGGFEDYSVLLVDTLKQWIDAGCSHMVKDVYIDSAFADFLIGCIEPVEKSIGDLSGDSVDLEIDVEVEVISESIKEEEIVVNDIGLTKEEVPMDVVDNYFIKSNEGAFAVLAKAKKFSANKKSIKTALVKKETLRKFEVSKDASIGVYSNVKFMVAVEDFNSDLVRFTNSKIRISGLNTEGFNSVEIFTLKVAMVMFHHKIGFEKIQEGLKKGYMIFLSLTENTSKKGKTYKTILDCNEVRSVGPLGEGHTGIFTNPSIPLNGEFGENTVSGRLVFETSKDSGGKLKASANKIVAREMKLGSSKQSSSTSIGVKKIYLFDEALNKGCNEYVKRSLVLGTAWVSKEDFLSYGCTRIIPFKAVTAPMPESMGTLKSGEIFVGGNTHKSKLNGVLYKAFGMSHSAISKLTEDEARSLLKPFEHSMSVFGEDVIVYAFDSEVFVTNFYVLYGLKGLDVDTDVESSSLMKGFYNDCIAKVSDSVFKGETFNLVSYVKAAIASGEVKTKARVVDITSAEIQQIAVSYGYTAAKGYIDSLYGNKTHEEKSFLTKGFNELPVVNKDVLFRLGSDYLIGEIDTTIIPYAFASALINKVGEGDFIISHKGYNFPFMGIGPIENVEKDGDYIKDASSAIVSVVKFIISLRYRNTNWDTKYVNHIFEINSLLMSKIQVLRTRGAYLPAVTGYWLNKDEIFSYGDKEGLVVSAKLPILFDQAVTSLENTFVSPYSDSELFVYESLLKGMAFVSPEFFLSQENDGDGDLIKVMKRNAYIPKWREQLSFTKAISDKYQDGEWSGLKLSLKPYVVMPYSDFHSGNFAAKTAKDNVAIMAANEYRVKETMLPYSELGSLKMKEYATMIIEASAYLVQYEAMRAAKHDGAVNFFDLVKCSSSQCVVFSSYISNWSELLSNYFGFTSPSDKYIGVGDFVPDQDYVDFITLLGDLFICNYSKLLPYDLNRKDEFDGFGVLPAKLSSFGLMQNGYSRTVGGYVGNFDIDLSSKLSSELSKKRSHVNVVYTNYLRKTFSKLTVDTVDSSCSPFVYFLYKIANYTPVNGGGDTTTTTTTTTTTEVTPMGDTSNNIPSSVNKDGSEYWNDVLSDVVFVSSDNVSPITLKALVKLKKGIMNITLNGGTLEDCKVLVGKYNAFIDSIINKPVIVDSVLTEDFSNCVKDVDTSNSDSIEVESISSVDGYVGKDYDPNGSCGAFKCATKAKDVGSTPLDTFDDGLPSTSDMRKLKYETRRFVFEQTVNTKPVGDNSSIGDFTVFKTLSEALSFLNSNSSLKTGSKSLKVVRVKGGFAIK